ncbi:MAG: hypothetical protein AB7U75_22640 [Hyphomicrobiaceae bacterium]
MTRVMHQDLRAIGYCTKGTREFFARHGLCYRTFVFDGIPAETLERTGDAMALELVAEARRREARAAAAAEG